MKTAGGFTPGHCGTIAVWRAMAEKGPVRACVHACVHEDPTARLASAAVEVAKRMTGRLTLVSISTSPSDQCSLCFHALLGS